LGVIDGLLGPMAVDDTQPGAPTLVAVPNDISAVATLPNCFRFDEKEAADCQESLPARTTTVDDAVTYAGQYPPLYYALVGWPSLMLSGEPAVYAMRLVSGALSTLLVVWGLTRLAGPSARRGLWGALIALTPMSFFMAGTVNPNGLEIAAAFSFWCASLALSRALWAPDGVRLGEGSRPPVTLVAHAVIAGAILINLRTSGPVWAVLIVGSAMLAARPGALRDLVRAPAVRWAAVAAAVASGSAVAWIATHGEIISSTNVHPELAAPRLVAAVMLLSTEVFVEQMIGNFGWLDTAAPYPTVLGWVASAATLLLVAVATPIGARLRAAIVALGAAVLLVPIALTIPTAQAAGIVWQGRYVLPLAVGLPLLAGLLLGDIRGEVGRLLDRVHTLTILLLGAAHVAAFYWAARRYAEGLDGLWGTLTPEWNPPLGFVPAVAMYVVLIAACGVLAWRAIPREAASQVASLAGGGVSSPGRVVEGSARGDGDGPAAQ